MSRLLASLAFFLAVLGCVLVVNALRIPKPIPAGEDAIALVAVDEERVARHLSQAIQLRTVSRTGDANASHDAFVAFHDWLATTYPATHSRLRREVVNGGSLLYVWPGRQPELAPVAFLCHMDVVPVEAGTEKRWTHPPFSGRIADGFVWGRGAIDMKGTLVTVVEAVEKLAARGFTPERGVVLAFGHDEEVGGTAGAKRLAQRLGELELRPAFSIDEGGMVLDAELPGIDRGLALIGVAEKGYLTLEIVARGQGGHSSMPPSETAVGRLAQAVTTLEGSPFPARIAPIVGETLDRIGAVSPFVLRIVLGNRWLFESLITRLATLSHTTAAMVRTTTAVTMLEASPQENVLASEATAVVNFRIAPGESAASVRQRVIDLVGSPHVSVHERSGDFASEPSPVASASAEGFRAIERSLAAIHPAALSIPALLVGGTDSRHYAGVVAQRYRFSPVRVSPDDTPRIHGTDERLEVASLRKMVQFYVHLIETTAGPTALPVAAR